MKIHPVGNKLLYSAGQRGTDRNDQASSRLPKFCAGS